MFSECVIVVHENTTDVFSEGVTTVHENSKDVFSEAVAKKCHEHYNTVPPEQVCPAPILLKEHLKQLP